jgi:hypothetical protein
MIETASVSKRTMSFNLDRFIRIISTIEDVLSMLDDAQITISTNFEYDENEPENHILNSILKLSFKLKNGFAKLSINNERGIILYYDRGGEMVKEVKFGSADIFAMNSEFIMAIKEIVAADKQNKKVKASLTPTIEFLELDRIHAKLSDVN